MATLNARIILAHNIKIDKGYQNVLNYNEQQLLDLVNANVVVQATNYSFIREENAIVTNFSYNDVLQCNYMAYQNTDYSNKWFFAWIDDITYSSNGATKITFTIDVWSTWFNQLTLKPCFVEREHVNDDTVGIHTLPEKLEHGEYITEDSYVVVTNGEYLKNDYKDFTITDNSHICIGTTYLPTSETAGSNVTGTNAYGIFGGIKYYVMKDVASAITFINWCDKQAKADAIQCIFYVPDWVIMFGGWETVVDFTDINGFYEATEVVTLINKPTSLGYYTPVNKKLLTYPFVYLQISNNAGNTANYKFENIGTSQVRIHSVGTITPSCSVKHYIESYSESTTNFDNGLTGAKYPVCNWSSDVYTNWLTSNAVNNGLGIAGSVMSTAVGAVTGNAIGVASGVLGVAQTLGSYYQHSLEPHQSKGNINSGDVAFTKKENLAEYSIMHIKPEYAEIIDKYFSRYGYQINLIKVPNITGRSAFNFIKIGNSENIGVGSVPSKYLDKINEICRAGVTIWHNHNNVNDYNISNPII